MKLFDLFKREPDLCIGSKDDPYIRRWYVIPRNRWFNIYLHNMRRSDEDRALHDHPWWNVSIVLKGGYLEHTPSHGYNGAMTYWSNDGRYNTHWRRPGSIVFRRAEALHRLSIRPGEQSWSLFITGRLVREWGFACPKGWISHKQAIKVVDGVSTFVDSCD